MLVSKYTRVKYAKRAKTIVILPKISILRNTHFQQRLTVFRTIIEKKCLSINNEPSSNNNNRTKMNTGV